MNSKSPKYWVAWRGLVDSTVLVHLMHQKNMDFGILHCNFHLRGEDSNRDEKFVRHLAKKMNRPIRVQEWDTYKHMKEHHLNLELSARNLRYQYMDEIIQKENAIVLLAQHKEDQIETFFLQLRRGGQVKGLSGMPLFRNGYLRPLLRYRKQELIKLAQKNNWDWREDKSNANTKFQRNWYRNDILPFLKENGFLLEEVISVVHCFQEILADFNRRKLPSTIAKEQWTSYSIWYRNFILAEHQMGEFPEKEVTRLLQGEKGKHLGNKITQVWNEGNKLVFVPALETNISPVQLKVISVQPEELVYATTSYLFFDGDKIKGELTVRKWEKGDRFQPKGMTGSKTMGKFLRDKKVSAYQKSNIQVLVREENTIIGVFGYGIGEPFAINKDTSNFKRAELTD